VYPTSENGLRLTLTLASRSIERHTGSLVFAIATRARAGAPCRYLLVNLETGTSSRSSRSSRRSDRRGADTESSGGTAVPDWLSSGPDERGRDRSRRSTRAPPNQREEEVDDILQRIQDHAVGRRAGPGPFDQPRTTKPAERLSHSSASPGDSGRVRRCRIRTMRRCSVSHACRTCSTTSKSRTRKTAQFPPITKLPEDFAFHQPVRLA
jgi:hypothetical protein